jgi:hypothetical protein
MTRLLYGMIRYDNPYAANAQGRAKPGTVTCRASRQETLCYPLLLL